MTATGAAQSRYQILGHLASGGMGEILLARRVGPGGFEKLVVLKRPLATTAGSPAVVAALIEEARVLAQVNHANVCQIHDLEQADGDHFLVLEFLEGLSLWSIVVETEVAGRAIDPRIVCGLIEQACAGLDAIHRLRARDGSPAGVIHRDISPGNLFLTEDGTVKILDLGLAKRVDAADQTRTGTVRGKLPYLAPEQAAGRPLDARTDLFALGLVLHDLARGRRPPRGRIGVQGLDALDLDQVSPPLAAIIRRAVAGDPAARFDSAGAMASAVRATATGLGGSCSRTELAAWLGHDFARALEVQRERTRAAMSRLDDPTVVTRTLTLQSMLPSDDSNDTVAEPPGATPGARSAEPPVALAHHTERLAAASEPLPDLEPTVPPGSAPPGAAWSPRHDASELGALVPDPRARIRWGLAGALAVITLGAVIAWFARDPERAASERHPAGWSSAGPEGASVAIPRPDAPPGGSSAAGRAPVGESSAALGGSSAQATASRAPPGTSRGSAQAAPDHVAAGSRASAADAITTAGVPRATPIPPRAATGVVTIDSQPYAIVTLGSASLGETPLFHRSVRTGRYTVHAAIPDGRTQDLAIRIDAGRECRVMLRWNGAATTRAGCQ